MAGTIRLSKIGTRRVGLIRQIVVFSFARINVGQSVNSPSVALRNFINNGEVIVSQRSTAGSIATPVVRYQFVNALTGRPVSNALTVTGNRVVVLPFSLPAATVRLRITNVGSGPVTVQGAILVF